VVGDDGPVNGPDDFGGVNPFEGIPFFNDLAKMFQSQGAGSWDTARQFAVQLATGGQSEPNPDPAERLAYEALGRVADMHVNATTGLSTSTTGRVVTVVPVSRAEWVRRSLDAWRPLLERLSTSLTSPPAPSSTQPDDPLAAMLQGLSSAFGPLLFGMQAGSMVGHLATRALGQYDLPIPRPPNDELVVVARNVAEFGEAWDLPTDDLRLWLCISELATHSLLGVPHVRQSLNGLLLEYAGGFRIDPSALEDRLGDVDPTDLSGLQQALGDPTALLGAIQSQAQRDLLPRLESLVTVIVGYVDWVVDTVGSSLIGNIGMLSEALRRRRVEAGDGDRFVEHLIGLELGQAQYDRGGRFIEGVVERAGRDGLARLWQSPRELPTPAEIDAPGLWLARIDLPD
jgi:putative hydrolase